ncbi:MAG: hypothetical protein ACXAES_06325 [Promethearchaeota archaeon]
MIEWSKERLAAYKYPRKVEFIRTLPRTTIGKPFRRKLREMELDFFFIFVLKQIDDNFPQILAILVPIWTR